jgi:hypothetical protein
MILDNEQRKQMFYALVRAFPSKGELERMVRFSLGENMASITRGENLNDIVYSLVEWAEAHGRLEALITAARNENPTNPDLNLLAHSVSQKAEMHNPENSRQTVQIPFVVGAMTYTEATNLVSGSVFDSDNVAPKDRKQFEEFIISLQEHLPINILSNYGQYRENWKPSTGSTLQIGTIILDVIRRTNEKTYISGLNLPLLKAQFISKWFFAEDPNTRKEVWRRLGQSGYVLIIDAVSLFHPGFRQRLLQSQMGVNEQQVSMVVLSPLSSNLLRPNIIVEDAVRDQMQRAFALFSEDLDWRYEFGISDLRAMQRWLISILVETAKTAQRPKANSYALESFRNQISQPRLGIEQLMYGTPGER